MNKYRVELDAQITTTLIVESDNEDSAVLQAISDLEFYTDIEVYNARPVTITKV